MTAKLHESLHPLLVQLPSSTQTSEAEPSRTGEVSLAVVISQTRLCINPGGRGDLCLEVRELEAAGDRQVSFKGYCTVCI